MNDRNVWIRIGTSVSVAATLALGLLSNIAAPVVHAATSTAIDDFETGGYTGGTGWTGNWVEVNDSGVGQSPTSGDIRIVSDGGSQRLRVKDDSRGAYRLADLSSASAAFLTFEYRRGNLNSASDYVLVQLSSSGASGPWTEVGRIEGSGSDASYIRISFDITSPSGYTQHVPMGGITEQRAIERAREMIDLEISLADDE